MTLPDGGSQSGPRAEPCARIRPARRAVPLSLDAARARGPAARDRRGGRRAAAPAAPGVHQHAWRRRSGWWWATGLRGPSRRASACASRVPRGQTMVAQWELVRPLSADGQPMGEEVRGSSVLRGPSGTMSRRGARAAPRTTPTSRRWSPTRPRRPSASLVNAGLQGAIDCGCAVRPGARRVFIGYYRLYQNSTVARPWAGRGDRRSSATWGRK